jgi:hypothetical protein
MAGILDVDTTVDGPETEVLEYQGCPEGVGATLWRMVGSTHIPFLQGSASDSLVGWVIDHPRSPH